MKPGDPNFPAKEFMWYRGELWQKRRNSIGDYIGDYIELGICPTPQTTLQCLLYHIGHGLVMQYPIIDILAFSWRNRNSFCEEAPPEHERAIIEIVKIKPKIKRIRAIGEKPNGTHEHHNAL